MFQPVSSKANFPEVEEHILRFWKERHIFERSVEAHKGAPRFTLYEGPPTANGSPGIHHVLARVYKDVIVRYKTMKGFYTPRRAGWDTHGLPVELEVERELGLTHKTQIEEYGVDRFNTRCRESVLRYLKQWEEVTERIGFWLDMEHPYVTFNANYIESCWWIIRQLWDKGLIYQGYRVTPHCPRCETSLSSHEVALGYRDDTEDPSVYVKFKLDPTAPKVGDVFGKGRVVPGGKPAFLLAWTTTPWTLPGNTALAVAPDAEYSLMEGEEDYLIMASALKAVVGNEDYKSVFTIKGTNLTDLKYEPLFDPSQYGIDRRRFEDSVPVLQEQAPGLTYPVIGTDFVSMEEGTGVVHIAPAFGEVDFEAGINNQLDFVQQVDLQGNIAGSYPFSGFFVKDADPFILHDLESRGLLYRSEKIRHTYPFCWRCGAPLLYYAKTTWYIKTTAVKDRLISGNTEINWYPKHIKYGRFGDWLENNVDWAFSRERYWGTPLPIWRCESHPEHIVCIESFDELRGKAGVEGMEESLDPHRPFVDRINFTCPKCGGKMRRVPEVIDCWFDSGAMPVAQQHYPFENRELFQQTFPADYICEAVDQTRGWFYSLHALSILLFDCPCFKNVICLGHILDAQGEKMSKAKGNVIKPEELLAKQGADALRWSLLTSSPAGNVKRFSPDQVTEVKRRFLLTLWNVYSFFVTYANIDRCDPTSTEISQYESQLDRWITSELNKLILEVTTAMDNYNPTEAGRRIESFVEELSNWYVRRSRRRFWKSENDADKLAAYITLYQCLTTTAKLLAPLTPFLAEELYQNLVRSVDDSAAESVHLTDFPTADNSRIDEQLSAGVETVMKVCSLGRAARSNAGIKVRQPVKKVLVKVRTNAEREGLKRLTAQVLDELNVKKVEFIEDEKEVVNFEVKLNLPILGPKYGKEVQRIADALGNADAAVVAADIQAGIEINLAGYHLSPDDLLVVTHDKPDYTTATSGGCTVAIATQISPQLIDEGIAREMVHRLQTIRRNAGFDIADYIVTYYQGDETIQRVMTGFADYIKQETLSRQLIEDSPEEEAYTEKHRINGLEVIFGVKKAK